MQTAVGAVLDRGTRARETVMQDEGESCAATGGTCAAVGRRPGRGRRRRRGRAVVVVVVVVAVGRGNGRLS